jgi:membrane protein YdbS with pleckstrin-like domain
MADAYLQSLLGTGETIRSEARQHPMALIRFALQPILVFIAALVCLAIGTWLVPDGQGLFGDIVRWFDTLLGLVTAGLFILAIVWFPIQVFRWTKRRYMVTDRRVLYVDGVLRKNSVDAGLNMITDVGFRQGVIGRSLGYGDLVVATASNRPLHFRQIKGALDFKQAIMTAQHATVEARADEILVSKGLAPAATAPVAAAVAAVPAPVAPPPPAVPAWDGSDVPEMLEDDTPALDPAVLGADGAAHAAEAVEAAVPEAAAVPVAAEPEAAEPEAAELEAAEPAVPVESEAVAAEATDAVAEATEPVEAAVETAGDDGADVAAEVVEPAAAEVEDASEAVATAASGTAGTSHAEALSSIDSTIGGLTEDATDVGADTVTAALATLADERDSGAITEEEFETRKQELLDRL